MAHYAFIDEHNIVTAVIVGRDEDSGDVDWETYYGDRMGMPCKRTSYNTRGGRHLGGGQPYRGNYAGIGYTYDETLDAFIPPRPFPSWTLDESTFWWRPPVDEPLEGGPYEWSEDRQQWLKVTNDQT